MKKFTISALFVLIAVIAITGCQTAQKAGNSSIPPATAASTLATSAYLSMCTNSTIYSSVGIQSLGTKNVSAKTITPTYTDGWWSFNSTITGISTFDANFKIFKGSVEITTEAALNALTRGEVNELDMFATWTLGGTIITLGAGKADPLKYTMVPSPDIIPGTTRILNGAISTSGRGEDGTTYAILITYSNITIGSNGYPIAGGSASFTITSGGVTVYAGTISFDGTKTATITFTTGVTGTYKCDLSDGSVVAASI